MSGPCLFSMGRICLFLTPNFASLWIISYKIRANGSCVKAYNDGAFCLNLAHFATKGWSYKKRGYAAFLF